MGKVFLAEQRSLAREVAIKTVKDPLDAGQLEALLWEGAIAGHLDHPGFGHRWSDLLDGDEDIWARFPMLPKNRLRAHLVVAINLLGAGIVVFFQLAPSKVFNAVGFLTLAGLAFVFRRTAIAHSSGAGRSAETPK